MREFHKIIQSDLATADIQVLWDEFVTKLQQGTDTCIPVRKAGSTRKFAASCTGETNTTSVGPGLVGPLTRKKLLDYKHLVRRAYEKYIGDILGLNQETDDLDTPPKVNTKKTILPA